MEDNETVESGPGSTLLSLAYGGGRLGAALYDPTSMRVDLMADTLDRAPDFDQMSLVINQTHPDQVITSCKQDERLLRKLRLMFDVEETVNSLQSALHLVPSMDFRADTCRHRVMAIVLPDDNSSNDEDHTNFIRSTIDFSQTSMIRALGGLLKFLDRNPQQTSIGCQHIMKISPLMLHDYMYISRDSLQSLQVFANVMHPSSYKAETFREGLSLFGILNKCTSQIGVVFLKKFLLQPLKNQKKLEERLNLVEFFTLSKNHEIRSAIQANLRRLRNLSPLLKRMNNWHPLSTDWEKLITSLTVAVSIVKLIHDVPSNCELFSRTDSLPGDDIYDLLKTLQSTINLTETKELKRFTVQLGLDGQLDRCKQAYNDMSTLLEQNLEICQTELPEEVDVCSMTFFPMIGFMVLVESWSRDLTVDEKLNLTGLEFQFSDEERHFYKSPHCRTLDQEIGDLSLTISDTESIVQHRLIRIVLDATEQIHNLVSFCGEVDAIISLSQSAIEYDYTRPVFVDSDYIILDESRHPILELCSNTVVPNDFKSGVEPCCDRVKIITGANGSGKSVYLKQVALSVFMAQCGSFVPARRLCLGIQQALFTVMPASSVPTGQQSSFMHELQQLSAALRSYSHHDHQPQQNPQEEEDEQNVTSSEGNHQLIVMDELGGGTLSEDGTALLTASLQLLIDKQQRCPHTLVSTHAHQVLSLLTSSPLVTPLSPQVVVDTDNGQMTCLYKIQQGVAGSGGSQALAAAKHANLPQPILDRAHKVLENFATGGVPDPDPNLKNLMSNAMSRCCSLVEKFMNCDLETADVRDILAQLRQT